MKLLGWALREEERQAEAGQKAAGQLGWEARQEGRPEAELQGSAAHPETQRLRQGKEQGRQQGRPTEARLGRMHRPLHTTPSVRTKGKRVLLSRCRSRTWGRWARFGFVFV